MRPLLKYGIPLAGGLATAGGALAQGEDPGTAALAGIAGGAGAAGGLLAARGLAGKYAPALTTAMQESVVPLGQKIRTQMEQAEPGSMKRKMLEKTRESLARGYKALDSGKTEPYLGAALAGGLVPGSAALAGLGGVAAGAIPGALGVPGFQQPVVDPESYGSSNSMGARYKAPTMQYV